MVKVTDLVKVFHDGRAAVTACERVSFGVPAGRFFTLLGPSGCGKTTTLRSIAGLERPDDGQIELDGTVVYSSQRRVFVPPNHRDVGMVFQSYAIWLHMTVFDNVAFPLRAGRSRFARRETADRVRQVLGTVRLDGLEHRPATRLSGGQQQRLELRQLQRTLGITTIYVTHDQVEALALSNVVAVMHEGRIIQVGTPREIYERRVNRFATDFIGATNLVPGHVAGAAGGDLYRVKDGKIDAFAIYFDTSPFPK